MVSREDAASSPLSPSPPSLPSPSTPPHGSVPLRTSPPTDFEPEHRAATTAPAPAGNGHPTPTPTQTPPSPSPSASPASSSAQPRLLHNLEHGSSVLALAVSASTGCIYAGTRDGEIVAWCLSTFAELRRVQAHKHSVLCLSLTSSAPAAAAAAAAQETPNSGPAEETSAFLISSACDPLVNVWCPRTLSRLYEIYGIHDVGDIFSVAYSPRRDTVYVGAQNTTVQWARLGDPRLHVPHDSARHPDRRNHRFFDSKAVGGTSTPRRNEDRWGLIPRARHVLEMDPTSVLRFAHFGYVYCMLMARGPTVLVDADEDVLISGSGDGTIKLWRLGETGESRSEKGKGKGKGKANGDEASGDSGRINNNEPDDETIEEIMCLGTDDAESVLSLAIDGSFLYGGKLDGIVELWDLDTKQKLRVVKAHEGDVMSVQMAWGCLWSAAATGSVSKHSTVHYGMYPQSEGAISQRYQCLNRWRAHDGKILASAVATHGGNSLYITGANDNFVAIWKVQDDTSKDDPGARAARTGDDVMFASLAEFVSFKTISSRPEYAEDCRKGATFLGALLKKLGGQVEFLGGGDGEARCNPVVLATFRGKLEPAEQRRRILFYGHYDVVPADGKKGHWLHDPFRMKGINGYLYGRGVSDNKGPVVAALYAVTDLMQARALENDVVFLIEGEEESGSRGFREAVAANRDLVGRVDYILLANSYWLDDDVPCLTYGLRGVLHATAEVRSRLPDKHSGVDGSHMMDEPLSDLTRVLGTLKGRGNIVAVPGFYDHVRPVTAEEEARYDDITSILLRRAPRDPVSGRLATAAGLKASLMARWREPNLTIHRYRVSGPDGSLVSSQAAAHVSLRLVPGQEAREVADALRGFLEARFAELGSANAFELRVDNIAEPWLGEPGNAIFRTLERAVMRAWADCFEGSGGAESGAESRPEPESPLESRRVAGASAVKEWQASMPSDAPADPVVVPKPKKPLYIREGGSIPAIRFLEKEFGAPAAHLPCGQSTDSAHLDNERIRVLNLLKSREIFRMVFAGL